MHAPALAIVTDRWDAEGGGRERYIAELVAYLARRKERVDLFCRTAATSQPSAISTLTVCAGPSLRAESRLDAAIGRYRNDHPANSILTTRPCVGATHYQLHSGLYRSAYAAERESFDSSLRRLFYGPALRVNMHRALALRAEARMLAGPQRPSVMVFSSVMRDDLERQYGIPRENISILPLGVDLGRFHPVSPGSPVANESSGAPLRLLFVGHNFLLKGLASVVRALSILRTQGVNAGLTVVGAGPIPHFRRLARQQGIGSAVDFKGALDQVTLAALYRAHDALVHPTFYDPFPRVILEALASGCPVLTTRRCGASESIASGRDGIVIDDPHDVESLAVAIARFADREILMTMRSHAAASGRRFSFNDHAWGVLRWLQTQHSHSSQP